MYFEFCNPGKILSGKYALENIAIELKLLGVSSTMILSGKTVSKNGYLDMLKNSLEVGGIKKIKTFSDIPSDSSIESVNHIAKLYLAEECESIIAFGGGSVIDTAKGVRMLISQGGNDLLQYVGAEVLPRGKHVPFVVIPTTSGTGSEATHVAVIKNNEKKVKMEFISQFLLPDLAVIDPRFCTSMPKRVTAMTGLDALTHAVEAYICLQKNIISRSYATAAIELIKDNLCKAINEPNNEEVRLNMANGSLLAGGAFCNSMVGLVHAIGHSLGGICKLPHGLAMAILLVPCLEFNLEKCKSDYEKLLLTFTSVENYYNTKEEDRAAAFIREVEEFLSSVSKLADISLKLRDYDINKDDLIQVAKQSLNDGAMIVNPRAASVDDVLNLLNKAY